MTARVASALALGLALAACGQYGPPQRRSRPPVQAPVVAPSARGAAPAAEKADGSPEECKDPEAAAEARKKGEAAPEDEQ